MTVPPSTLEDALQVLADELAKRLELPKKTECLPDPYTSYTREQAAKRMNIPVGQIDSLRRDGVLRFDKFGGNVRILEQDIRDYYAIKRGSLRREAV